jgi:hypothetical protein
MWHWIRRWLDWAMNELARNRSRSPEQAVHLHYEKAGLQLLGPLIPWNAESVVLELLAKLPPSARNKSEFFLRIPGMTPIQAESIRSLEDESERCRIFFKFSVPGSTQFAEILWKQKLLTTVSIPVQSQAEFFSQLKFTNPTVSLQLDGTLVAAQSYIASQCQGIVAAIVLKSSTALAPLADLPLLVRFEGIHPESVPLRLTANQLASRECLLIATAPRAPKRAGAYEVIWQLDGQLIQTHRLIGLSARQLLESIRVVDTRFVWEDEARKIHVTRQAPALEKALRIGPCFVLASRELGAAASLLLNVTTLLPGAVRAPIVLEQTVLLTDGPTIVSPGLVDPREAPGFLAFELRYKNKLIATAPLAPIPQAKFDGEGGFQPPAEFQWNSLADEELAERLQKLFGSN